MLVIADGVVTLQFDVAPGEGLPGTEEHFASALRHAVVGRLSLHATVRATLVLPYAVESRVEQAPADADAESQPGLRPREFAVIAGNDPDSSARFSRFAAKGVTPVRQLPGVSDDIVLQFDPGEYFLELRRGASWAEVEHPVALNRVSYFAERQAAGRALN